MIWPGCLDQNIYWMWHSGFVVNALISWEKCLQLWYNIRTDTRRLIEKYCKSFRGKWWWTFGTLRLCLWERFLLDCLISIVQLTYRKRAYQYLLQRIWSAHSQFYEFFSNFKRAHSVSQQFFFIWTWVLNRISMLKLNNFPKLKSNKIIFLQLFCESSFSSINEICTICKEVTLFTYLFT